MVKVTFVDSSEMSRSVDITAGLSVMEGAIGDDISEIEAECGGNRLCATCHVYIATEWLTRLPPPEEPELDLLTLVTDRKESSRLSCQIRVTEALDGLVVHTPRSQR